MEGILLFFFFLHLYGISQTHHVSILYSKKAVLEVQKTQRICILDVEINGVKSIKNTDLNARYLFVKPPSIEALVSIIPLHEFVDGNVL